MALFAFIGSPWQMLIILVIVLLIFGNRLPSAMRSLGRGVTEFKKGLSGEPEEGEEEAKKEIKEEVKKDATK
jgi:sec-independent protein translocase protein TatA